MEKIKILDIPMTKLSMEESVEKFIEYAQGEEKVYAATPNAEIILEAQKNSELFEYLKNCKLNFADSISILWAAEYQEKNWNKMHAIAELMFLPWRKKFWKIFPEKVTGSDSFDLICQKSAEKNIPIALIGGGDHVAQKTSQKLQKKYPQIQIVTAIDGIPFNDFWKDEILQKISGAAIVFVALGCPRQELWIRDNLPKVTSLRIGIGIGGTFDFYIGNIKRAPKIFQKTGFEWLYRLLMQPARWKRILTAVFIFPYKILTK